MVRRVFLPLMSTVAGTPRLLQLARKRRELAQRRLIGHPDLPAGGQHRLRLGDHRPFFSA